MKIGVFTDLRFTRLSTPTGVTKHIIQMLQGLYMAPNIELLLLVTQDQLDSNGNVPKDNALCYINSRTLPYSWQYLYWKTFFMNSIRFDHYTEDLDWVYCPKNDYLPLRNRKYAVTFHGAHELDPSYSNKISVKNFLNKIRSKWHYGKMVAQADRILVVSEFLKKKTVECFKADPSKIVIVGNGVEKDFYKVNKNQVYNANGPLLIVGGLNFLDGGDRILKIAKYFKANNIPRLIMVAGNQNDKNYIEQAINFDNIIFLGYLKEKELAEKMLESSLLLFLTRYETFGIAAAEAMAVGIPVVTHVSTAIPEIVGSAGIYIDMKEIPENIEKILTEKDFQPNIAAGKKIARKYKWSYCVDRLIQALD